MSKDVEQLSRRRLSEFYLQKCMEVVQSKSKIIDSEVHVYLREHCLQPSLFVAGAVFELLMTMIGQDCPVQDASICWSALELYALNLHLWPWKKELHNLRLFGGFYMNRIHRVVSDGAISIFESLGYVKGSQTLRFSEEHKSIQHNLHLEIALDCCLARLEYVKICELYELVHHEGYSMRDVVTALKIKSGNLTALEAFIMSSPVCDERPADSGPPSYNTVLIEKARQHCGNNSAASCSVDSGDNKVQTPKTDSGSREERLEIRGLLGRDAKLLRNGGAFRQNDQVIGEKKSIFVKREDADGCSIDGENESTTNDIKSSIETDGLLDSPPVEGASSLNVMAGLNRRYERMHSEPGKEKVMPLSLRSCDLGEITSSLLRKAETKTTPGIAGGPTPVGSPIYDALLSPDQVDYEGITQVHSDLTSPDYFTARSSLSASTISSPTEITLKEESVVSSRPSPVSASIHSIYQEPTTLAERIIATSNSLIDNDQSICSKPGFNEWSHVHLHNRKTFGDQYYDGERGDFLKRASLSDLRSKEGNSDYTTSDALNSNADRGATHFHGYTFGKEKQPIAIKKRLLTGKAKPANIPEPGSLRRQNIVTETVGKNEGWVCQKCTYLNAPKEQNCLKCLYEKNC